MPFLAHMIDWQAEKDFPSWGNNLEPLRAGLIPIVVTMRALCAFLLPHTVEGMFRSSDLGLVHIG